MHPLQHAGLARRTPDRPSFGSLEQLVDDYLKFNGFFTIHNVKFRPSDAHPDYIKAAGCVASDVDVVGFHPMRNAADKVWVVSCKSWQIGFDPKDRVEAIEKDKIREGRPAWQSFAKLVGYTTALHVMMDIGFNCVKPDIWLVRLMCRLGWIEDTLPAASTDAVIKKNYQEPRIAVAVITCARQIAQAMHAWHPEAPLREFDIVMVTYGQKVKHGQTNDRITRSLDESLPAERIMKWHPSSGLPTGKQVPAR